MQAGKPTKKGKRSKESPAATHLSGCYIFPNGDKYDGEYEEKGPGHIVRSGHGTHTTANGTVYTGEWKSDVLNGKGEIYHSTGARYKGDIKHGEYHGVGIYQWPDGSTFTGSFTHNRMDSRGLFTDNFGRQWVGKVSGKITEPLRLKLK